MEPCELLRVAPRRAFLKVKITMTSLLLRAVLDLLDQTSPEDWRKISTETGLEFAWLRKLANREIKEPGVNKVERLHKHLTGDNFPEII